MAQVFLFSIFCVGVLSGCSFFSGSKSTVADKLENHQEIRLIAIENPGFAYKNLEGKSRGFVYDLSSQINQLTPSRIQVQTVRGYKNLFSKLKKQSRSELIFTSLPNSVANQLGLIHTQPIIKSHYLLVCSKDHKSNEQKIILHPDAAESQLAKRLMPQSKIFFHDLQTRDLLLKVWRNPELCTVIDEKLMAVFHLELPELRIQRRFNETKDFKIYTALENASAIRRFNIALNAMPQELTKLQDIYFGSVRNFDYADYQIFLERLEEDLSSYARLFRKVAQKYNLSWTLLGAVAYQESHWDPLARSPTGVQGFMMLTEATAKAMGVKNIKNLEDNLEGGAKYLRTLFDQLPRSIAEADKPLFVLAAYNAGQGLLQKARIKTRTEGKNPDRWVDVAEVFPRLSEESEGSQRKLASNLKSKSLETLQFVQKVRFYEIFLKQREKAWQSSRQLTAQDDEPEN